MTPNPYASPQSGAYPGHGEMVSLVTPRVVLATARCRPWLFVLSMACFIALAVGVIGMLVAEGDYDEKGIWVADGVETGSLVGTGIVWLIQFLCGIFFWKFGVALGRFGRSRNENDLVAALRSELNLIRVVGITALAYVVLIAIAVAAGLAAGNADDSPDASATPAETESPVEEQENADEGDVDPEEAADAPDAESAAPE